MKRMLRGLSMSVKKSIIILTAIALCVVLCGLFFSHYVVINGSFIDRDTAHVILGGNDLPNSKKLHRFDHLRTLDLREIKITVSDYESLRDEFQDCDILWKVPFHGDRFDNMITELVTATFYEDDINTLRYFPKLETVDARGCGNYDALLTLREARPDLTVMYEIRLGDGQILRENATECTATYENIRHLLNVMPYLPNLRTVNSQNCTDYEALMQLQKDWPELELNYAVIIGDSSYDGKSTQLTLSILNAQDAMEKLQYFPDLRQVVFTGMAEDLDLMYQLKCRYPEVVISWDFELCGVATNSTATELILNDIQMTSTETVEDALKYFYHLEWVEMCRCGIPSEEMDALWKRHPETRFVWAIPMGDGFVRTDVKAFIPFKFGYDIHNPFYDTQAKELKYLVDLECLDLGHMRMTDISFLQYMPKLRFLILADVICKDFSYMENLTELVYIELFRSEFDDVRLLMNMKKLEDLNIGWTNLKNPELLKEMTWLKRLWTAMNGMTGVELEDLRASLPDTYVYINSKHPTEGGWRQSYLYFEMRDMLDMHYMK